MQDVVRKRPRDGVRTFLVVLIRHRLHYARRTTSPIGLCKTYRLCYNVGMKHRERPWYRARYNYEFLFLLIGEKRRNVRDRVRRRKNDKEDITTVDLVEYARERLGLPPIPASLLETEKLDSD